MTIRSASEYIRLRQSEVPNEYNRAATESAPLAVWDEVIDEFPEMRFWVAQNKSIPFEVLKRLARDSDPRVRWMVASKRKLDPETMKLLARDEDESVRAAVARNKKAPREVLELLRDDVWENIRNTISERLQ
jgi:hypothetical protein